MTPPIQHLHVWSTPTKLHTNYTMPSKPKFPVLPTKTKVTLGYPFSEEKYRKRIAALKNGKADSIDDVLVDQKCRFNLAQVAYLYAQQMFHIKQGPNIVGTVKDHHHTHICQRFCKTQ